MVRRLTAIEFNKRFTKSVTKTMACKCMRCGEILEIESGYSDGIRCSSCGNYCFPIGYLEAEKPQKTRTQHEAAEQEAVFKWASCLFGKHPELRLMFHIPNGGSRNKREAANLKRQGVKSGVPDICLPVARGDFHGLFIEMKVGKNIATENQKQWLEALQEQGYAAVICVGCEQAIEVITKYLQIGGKENE